MAPVLIKAVNRCSSEDLVNGKVENILRSQVDPSAGRWTCSKHDTNERLEAEFQLERSSFINHVDIGNYGSAFVEVFVGNSMWSREKEFISLLPSAMLMLPADCKQWRQTTSVRMFFEESLNKRALKENWDCVRVICRQPYRKDKQFGLSFIRFETKDEEVASSKSPVQDNSFFAFDGSSPVTPKDKKLLAPRMKKSTIRNIVENTAESPAEMTRASKMLQAALDSKSKRPGIRQVNKFKDDYILDDDDHHYYYDGKDAMKNARKRHTNEEIEIIEKKKGRVVESHEPEENSWMINDDIEDEVKCFLDGIDFTKIDLDKVTYSDLRRRMEKQRGQELSRYEKKTFLKIARDTVAHVMEEQNDDDEPGSSRHPQQTEQEESFFQDLTESRRSQPKRTNMLPCYDIDDDILTDEKSSPRKGAGDSAESITAPSLTNDENRAHSETEQLTECPICGELFSSLVVEEHASTCMNFTGSASNNPSPLVECPICSKRFPSANIVYHANYCVESFGRHEDPEAIVAL